MRRRAILERVEKEPEPFARFFRRHTQGFEDESLHVAAVNTNRAAGHFDAVDDRVVSLRANVREQVCLAAFDCSTIARRNCVARLAVLCAASVISREARSWSTAAVATSRAAP